MFDIFLKKPKRVEKNWGYELVFANNEENNYCGKILHIYKAHKFSMHFHDIKCETFYILNGKVQVSLLDLTSKNGDVLTRILNVGDCLDLPRLQPHQIEALEESDIIEASTFHRDEDSYRIWR
jgi:mannose-6-phosphate isomerase-like protein (cupin superfamily)